MINKVEKKCAHYGKYGGCSLQHLDSNSYLKYKYDIFKQAITQGGFPNFMLNYPMIIIGPFSRRRAQIKAINLITV
ncbi:MAG: hypothetical protein AB8U25_07625 [Rickettsiales endosymbiont of Dermacentor nuttalli]